MTAFCVVPHFVVFMNKPLTHDPSNVHHGQSKSGLWSSVGLYVVGLFSKFISHLTVIKVEILRWGNCTCTLEPSVSACGPLIDSWGPQVIIEPQSIYSFIKTVFFFNRCTFLR